MGSCSPTAAAAATVAVATAAAVANGSAVVGAKPEAAENGQAPVARAGLTRYVILDLDGTLLDTELLVQEAGREVVESAYGRVWTGEGEEQRLGRRPLECAQVVVDQYQLPCTADEFLAQTKVLLAARWHLAKALPGAERLLRHLAKHGIPMALASNSPRVNIEAKISYHDGWKEMLAVRLSGDEVSQGKPHPEIFLRAAELLNAPPEECLVVEDSPAGAQGGLRAGMRVAVVPSLPQKGARKLYTAVGVGDDDIYASLLDLRLEKWGLPPFDDWVADALPIAPWRVGGTVVKGFGRGSKILGIPTANLPMEAISHEVSKQVCGIYLGWAGLADKGVHKMVMSVGWNPYFNNTHKTVEPWLLHEFEEDFYGEELRLIIVGYIRPEANFPSLEALISRIREDGEVAKVALDLDPFKSYASDPFLTTPLASGVENGQKSSL